MDKFFNLLLYFDAFLGERRTTNVNDDDGNLIIFFQSLSITRHRFVQEKSSMNSSSTLMHSRVNGEKILLWIRYHLTLGMGLPKRLKQQQTPFWVGGELRRIRTPFLGKNFRNQFLSTLKILRSVSETRFVKKLKLCFRRFKIEERERERESVGVWESVWVSEREEPHQRVDGFMKR